VSGWQTVQPLGLEDTVDGIAIEVRQEVGHHKGEVIEGKASGPAQGTDDGPLLVCGFPGQLVGPGRAVLAVRRSALAPFADGLGAHAEAPGQHARGLQRAGDLAPDKRSGAGVGVNGVHQDLLPRGNRRRIPSKRQA
jgi:hypothetical protein